MWNECENFLHSNSRYINILLEKVTKENTREKYNKSNKNQLETIYNNFSSCNQIIERKIATRIKVFFFYFL